MHTCILTSIKVVNYEEEQNYLFRRVAKATTTSRTKKVYPRKEHTWKESPAGH
jgi:hypothetical protein